MEYQITHRTYGECPTVEALVSSTAIADPGTYIPDDWPAGSMIYTADYSIIKTKDLDGGWVEAGTET